MTTEREGSRDGYGQSYGNGKGTGNLPMKNKLPESAGNFFVDERTQSELLIPEWPT